jgi:hypothetical protein
MHVSIGGQSRIIILFLSANHSEKLNNTVNIIDPDFDFKSPYILGYPLKK